MKCIAGNITDICFKQTNENKERINTEIAFLTDCYLISKLGTNLQIANDDIGEKTNVLTLYQ